MNTLISEEARCAICGEPIPNDELVVLEDVDGDGRWAVVVVGLQPGTAISGYIVLVHSRCLMEHGRYVGVMPGSG
jgi:hypothetical protein